MVINGPNLNLLGLREPAIYGHTTYAELCERIQAHADRLGITVSIGQSNHEGDLVDMIQAAHGQADGILINAAAYTHTSIALLDALKAVPLPAIEVHLTDPDRREPFRQTAYLRAACLDTVSGHGPESYLIAMDRLCDHLKSHQKSTEAMP